MKKVTDKSAAKCCSTYTTAQCCSKNAKYVPGCHN